MARLTVGVMVLAGITLAGGLGGYAMREGARQPRPRAAASPAQPLVALRVAGGPCSTAASHPDAGCDAVAPAGD